MSLKYTQNILIVDDNPPNLLYLETILMHLNVNIIKAKSGIETLSKIRGQELAVAIIDIQMPGMNGFELAQSIKSQKRNQFVPVIFLTAHYYDKENIFKGYETGAVDYIIKPIERKILLSKIKVFLELDRQKNQILNDKLKLKKTISELRLIKESLRKSEEKFRVLYNNSPDMYASVSPDDASILLCNDTFLNNTGYSRKEIIGSSGYKIYHDDCMDEVKKALQQFLETGVIHDKELIVKRKDGSKIDVSLNVDSVRNEAGKILYFISSWRDITERKKAEDELRTSEAQLSNAMEIAKLGYWEYDVDDDLFTFNDHFYDIFRTTAKKAGGYKMSPSQYTERFLHPDDIAVIANEMKKAMETTDPNFSRQLEHRIIYADGEIGYISVRFFIVKDRQGRTVKTYGANQDITERKQAEEKIKHLNRVLRAIRNVNQLITKEKDRDRLIKRACENLISTRGYFNAWIALLDESGKFITTAEAGLGKDFLPMIELMKSGKITACGKNSFKKKDVVIIENPLIECKDCPLSGKYANRNAMTIRLEYEAKIYGFMSVSIPEELIDDEEEHNLFKEIAEDIAFALHSIEIEKERKQAEEALRKSEEQYRDLVEKGNIAIAVDDIHGNLIYFNNHFLKLFGYSDEEIKSKTHKTLVHPDDFEMIPKYHEKRMQGKETPSRYEFRGIRNDGSIVNIEIDVCESLEKEGKFSGTRSYLWDITERKKIEDKLKDSEIRYHDLFENSSEFLFTLDLSGNFTDVNNAAEVLTGYKKSELVKMNFKDYTPKRDHRKLFHVLNNIYKTGKPFQNFPIEAIIKDKSIKYFETSFSLMWKGEQIIGFQGSSKNITNRKQAEEELRKEKRFTDNIIATIPDSLIVIDKNLKIKSANQTFYETFHIKQEKVVGASIIHVLGSEDGRLSTALTKLFGTDDMLENFELHYRSKKMGSPREARKLTSKGERIFNIMARGIIIAEEEEEEEELVVLQDITESKQVENALKESEEMYRTLLNTSPDGIVITDLKGRIIEVSNIAIELYGTDNYSDLVGKQFFDFIPKELHKKAESIFNKTLIEGLMQNIEINLLRKDQLQFIGEISTTLIQYPGGKPRAYMAIIRDISHRKKMEKQLIHSERMAGIGEMAAGIAHEINQPLNTISFTLDNILYFVKNNNIDKKYLKKKTDKIFDNISRMRNIIDHVRTFSRDHDDFILSEFNINNSITNSLSLVSEQFKHKGIHLILLLNKSIQNPIGNTNKFEQVILNLLINAKDAIEDKKKKLNKDFRKTIEIETYQEINNIFVEIKDNGIGVNTEDIDNIMLPFYTTKSAEKGTGLGLSISYGIIKEMNGDIEINSELLNGTLVKITIPIKTNGHKHKS